VALPQESRTDRGLFTGDYEPTVRKALTVATQTGGRGALPQESRTDRGLFTGDYEPTVSKRR